MFKVNFEFVKSIIIKKSQTDVYQTLSDVNQWNNWSPWACLEPEAKINFNKNEKTGYTTLAWDGKLIGSGAMEVTNKTSNQIDYDLHFYKPFNSTSKVWFTLKESNGDTEVIWGMKSSLPFFLFFLKKMMVAYLSADYERGLLRLKEYMETGTLLCQMSDISKSSQNKFYVLGKRENTSITNLGPSMIKIFDQAEKDISDRKLPVPDGFISLYHKFDLIKAQTDYTAGIFYHQKPSGVSGYDIIEMPNHESLKMTLKGKYDHLPTAWSKIFCYQRGNKVKLDKKTPFYELYLNSPKMVAPKDVLTEIRLAIK
jgi:effector-binding domain-containing protein